MAEAYEPRAAKVRRKTSGKQVQDYTPTSPFESENAILTALPQEEFGLLERQLEPVRFRSGAVLWEPNQLIESVYFPTSGMVSFLAVMRNGATAEVGLTGREGFVGIAVFLGTRDVPLRAIVQSESSGFKIGPALLRKLLPQMPRLEERLRRYACAQAMQVAQAAACNCLHQVPERLARWLAMSCDRVGSDLLPLTQEFLAQMLGCRRSSVTSAVGQLEKAGVIHTGHGQVFILDRNRLEKQACECYRIMRALSDLTLAT
jgi:CRP-like cAMP-binding protein